MFSRSELTLIVFLVSLSGAAHAHEIGLSTGRYEVGPGTLHAELQLSSQDALAAWPLLDENADEQLDTAALEAAPAAAQLGRAVEVHAGGTACEVGAPALALAEKAGVILRLTARCPDGASVTTLRVRALDALPRGHRHVAAVIDAQGEAISILHGDEQAVSVDAPAGYPTSAYIGLGVEHILIGWDHLLFLLALVLVGGRLRGVLTVVTAFTIAHSITLALTALGYVAPNIAWVEALIALSVAYVGLENFFVTSADRRWKLSFPFGLIHGFGFAAVLSEIGLPEGDVPLALVLFNVGVELGQLLVLAVAVPIIWQLRKNEWFRTVGVRALSVGVVATGLLWFAERALG